MWQLSAVELCFDSVLAADDPQCGRNEPTQFNTVHIVMSNRINTDRTRTDSCESDRGKSFRAAFWSVPAEPLTRAVAVQIFVELAIGTRPPLFESEGKERRTRFRNAGSGALGGSGWPSEDFLWTAEGGNRLPGTGRNHTGAPFPANLVEPQDCVAFHRRFVRTATFITPWMAKLSAGLWPNGGRCKYRILYRLGRLTRNRCASPRHSVSLWDKLRDFALRAS